MMRSVEDGLGTQGYKQKRKYASRVFWWVIRVIRSTLRPLGLCCVTALSLYATVVIARSVRCGWVVGDIRRSMESTDDLCTTPKHQGFEFHDAIVMKNHSLFSPSIISLSGDVRDVYERSRLCGVQSKPMKKERHTVVYVSYRASAFDPFESRIMFFDEQAICVQHMIEHMKRSLECGDDVRTEL